MRSHYPKPVTIYLFLLLALFLQTACGSTTPEIPTATIPATAVSSESVPASSPTTSPASSASNTPPATPTPPPPLITVEESSSNSGDSEPASTESTEPTRPALPAGLIGPYDFPVNVNPLTGETLADPSLLNRRPLAVKISNAPAIVRPQSGMNKADLVFEHYAEGGLTRFTAIFYGKDSDPVGSIRSGRFIDLEIPQMYDAAFAYSGSSGPLRLMFRNGAFFDRIVSPDFGHGGFFRVEDPNKAFEHTLFTSTYNLRNILEAKGQNVAPKFSSNMAFSEAPLNPGESVSKIEIQYDGTNATWVYNAGTGRYTRWTDGTAHVDANTGAQLSFKNIVAVAAHHEDTDILEDNVGGGHYSVQVQVWGEGPVSIFRDGQRFDGRWRREDPSHMLTFYDLEGNILPLATGNTFFQLVPLGFDRLKTTP